MAITIYYNVGDRATIGITARKKGAGRDPATLVASVEHPSGAVDTYTLGVDAELTDVVGLGEYELAFSITEPGHWTVGVKATGVVEKYEEVHVVALAPTIPGV